jgi:uncharacterized protein YuzE
MSLKNNLFNGQIPKVFNVKNFIVTNLLDDIISNNIVSNQVQAPVIQRVSAETGETDDFITQSELDVELNDLKSLLLGSDALSNSLNSIAEINSAINSDPQFYTHITSSISTKANQSDLNATNGNVSALDTRLDSAETTIGSHTTTLTSHTASLASHTTTLGSHTSSINTINSTLSTKANQSSLDTTNSNVSALQGKTNAMSYTGNTLTMNENIIVSLDENLLGNCTIGNASTDLLTVNSATTFNGSVSGLTKAMVGLGNCDNVSDINKGISSATQTALNAKANQSSLDTTNSNVSALQSKTNAMSYTGNTLTMNENIIVSLDEFLNGNCTIGNASTDLLTVNSATTFNGSVSGLTKGTVGLSNVDNTSDANKGISSATQTALNLKADDNSVVKLSTAQTIASTKTFSSSPIVPDVTALDNSGKVANTKYVDSAINTLIGGAPSALNSLNELALALSNDSSYSTTITTALSGKASLTNNTFNGNQIYNTGTVTFNNGLSSNVITLNGEDLDSRIDTDEANIASNTTSIGTLNTTVSGHTTSIGTLNTTVSGHTTSINSLNAKTNVISYDGASDTLSINAKLDIIKDIGGDANIYLGDAVGNDLIYLRGTIVANSCNITPTELSQIDGISQNIEIALNAKALNSATCHNTGTETWAGQKSFSTGITLNGTDLNTRLTNDESTISSHTSSISSINSSITTLNGKCSALTYDSGTDTTTISSKMSIAKDVSDNGSIYLGDGINSDVIYVRGNLSANSQVITPTQLGFVSGASSNLQTQISAKATDSAVCHNTGAETWAGIKTFSSAPVLPNNSISNAMINNTAISSGYVDATSSIQTQLSAKANDSAVVKLTTDQTIAGIKTFSSAPVLPNNSITNAMINNTAISSGYVDATSSIQTQISTKANDSAVVKLTTDQTIAGIKTFSSAPVLPNNSITNAMINNTAISSGYVDATSSIQTQLTAKATDSLTCHLAGTETVTGIKTFSANNIFSGTNNFNLINENINYVSGVTTSLSLDYTSCKGINLIATPTSNYSLAITNVPTGSTNATYTVTLITTAKYYVNSITINGTSRTLVAGGGLANVSINASATHVMQQLNICFLNSSTPVVTTNVISLW